MEIEEIKQHLEYERFFEVKFKDIDRIFTINIDRINTLDEFKDLLSRKLRGHENKLLMEEVKKSYPTREELKTQIKNLVGKNIIPKEKK